MTSPAAPRFRSLRDSIPIALIRSREAVVRHFRPMLAEYDVTEQQWRVLRVLGEAGVLDATEVGSRAVVMGPSITRIIRALDERGLITRERDETDGRRVLLELTADGKKLLADAKPRSHAVYTRIEKAFGAEKLSALVDMLNELSRIEIESDAPINGGRRSPRMTEED